MAKELNTFELHMFESGIRKTRSMEQHFDCDPSDLHFRCYKLGVIKGSKTADEMAARILKLIQDEKKWVAIHTDSIALQLYGDLVHKRKQEGAIMSCCDLTESSSKNDANDMSQALQFLVKNEFVTIDDDSYVFPTNKLVAMVK